MSQGFYIVTYGLGIYLLNRLIGFLSPMVDPELEGPTLPTKGSDQEFKPFQRRLPEFKFWCAPPPHPPLALPPSQPTQDPPARPPCSRPPAPPRPMDHNPIPARPPQTPPHPR